MQWFIKFPTNWHLWRDTELVIYRIIHRSIAKISNIYSEDLFTTEQHEKYLWRRFIQTANQNLFSEVSD